MYRSAGIALAFGALGHVAAAQAPRGAPDSLAAARCLLSSSFAPARSNNAGHLQTALDAARKGDQPLVHANAAVNLGRTYWLRYDRLAHRRMETTPGVAVRSISEALQPTAKVPDQLNNFLGGGMPSGTSLASGATEAAGPMGTLYDVRHAIESQSLPMKAEVNGAAQLAQALELFREAYDASPTNARAFNNVAMALAERSAWGELENFAQQHLKDHSWDPVAWMALGLALHRRGSTALAAAAFDSGLANMAPAERARFDRLDRVLPTATASAIGKGNDAQRAAYAQLYWHLYDPLWSRGGDVSHTEFLARVTFADLRWTVEERHVCGADSDRGDIYIRYGPPAIIATFGPEVAANEGYDTENTSMESTTWIYDSGLLFVFSGQPGFGTARIAVSDVQMINATIQAQPVRWDNINELHVDSMPIQVARFRGGHDSVDVVVATRPPYSAIVSGDETKEAVQTQFWLSKGGVTPVYHDSTDVASANVLSWTRRVAPGTYLYRTEASALNSKHAGRAMAQVVADADPRSNFAVSGFGVSDMLVASSAAPTAAGTRWTSLNAAPLIGTAPHSGQVSLVWENYDFGQRAGSAQYAVTVTMVRVRSEAGRVAANIVGALESLVKIDRQSDRVIIKYDRNVPYAAAFADEIDIALGGTPAGFYTLTLDVTDKVSGHTAQRSQLIAIRE